MKKAYSKDIWRSIKRGRKRFLSILIITALGVAMFTGLRAACEDLRYSADKFFDEQKLFDICVVSTLGLTDDDVEALLQVLGVEEAEGIYNKNVTVTVSQKEQTAEVRSFYANGLNQPYILEGTLPGAANEIAVTQNYLKDSGKEIGDTLVFEEELEEEEEAAFLSGEYVITAAVIDPMDVNGSESAVAFRSAKTTEYTFFITPDAVLSDIYTAVYLKLSSLEDVVCYSDEYEEGVKEVVEIIESQIKEQREQARYDEIVQDANKEIADAEEEMNQKLEEAKQELLDAEEEIAGGFKELEDGERELNEGEAEALLEIADAREKIEYGFSALDGARSELNAAQEEINAGMEELKQAKLVLEETQKTAYETIEQAEIAITKQITDNEAFVATMDEQLSFFKASMGAAWSEDVWNTYVNAVTMAYVPYVTAQIMEQPTGELEVILMQELSDAKTVFYDSLGMPVDSIPGLSQLAEGYGQVYATNQVLLAKKDALVVQKENAKAEFEKAWKQIEESELQLIAAQKQVDDGWDEVDGNHYMLSQALEELEANEIKAMEEIAEGRAQIEENRQKLLDAKEELSEGQKEYEEEKKEALEELQEAKAKVWEIDMAEWYVRDRGSLSGYANIKSDADCIESVGTAFPILFLVVAILISLTTITRMVEEERGLIGTYKALGFYDGEILRKYLVYAFLASILGGVVGDVCGFIVLPEIIFVIFGIMYSLPEFLLQFDILYGIGGIMIFVTGIVLATYFACRAELANMPAVLMRPKTPRSGSRVFLEYITPVWKRMSFLNKVTARNLFRYKKRLFMTISGIMGCTALLVCGFTIKDSVTELMPQQYEYTYRYDMMAVAMGDDNEQLLSYMEDENIEDYINIGIESVKLKNQSGMEESIQMFVIPDGVDLEPYIHLENELGETVSLTDTGVLITQNAGMVLNFGKEDTVLIQNLKLEQANVIVSDFVKNYMGNNIYISQGLYEQCFGEFEPNGVLVELADTCVDEIAFKEAFSEREGILTTLSIAENKEQFSVSVVLINLVVYIIIVMAAGLAFTVLFTLSATNISERERELATIKVLGFYDNEVHSYVNKETLILTGFGMLLGLPLGTILGGMLTEALKMPSIYFAVAIYPVSYVYSAFLTLVFALLVDFMTNRVLDDINPVEALKSVE